MNAKENEEEVVEMVKENSKSGGMSCEFMTFSYFMSY